MHLRSAALKLLGFSLLVGVFGVSMAEAGIRTVHPLRVKISLPDDGRFSEEVRGRFATTGELPEDWSLDIVTTNEEGAEVSRRTMTEEVASKQGSATSIPFVLDLADAPVKKSLAIRGEIRDVRGKVVARGRTVIEREEVVPAPTLSDLALVKTEENAQITFTYDHVGETGPVFPQLKVYEHTKNGPVVVESLQQVESVEAGERLTLNFEFPLPGDPESYLIEVDILNEARRSLTGIQKERLIVPGDFADVLAFASFPERFWRAGNDVQLIFSGVATKSEVPLLMKLSVFGLREGEEKVLAFESNREVLLEGHDFSEVITFAPANSFPQFEASLKLFRNGEVIEEKVLQTAYFAPTTPLDFVFATDWWVYILALFAFFGLVWGFWATRGAKGAVIGLFALGILLPSTGFAGTAWDSWPPAPASPLVEYEAVKEITLPEPDMVYNPSSTEGFQKMLFQGSVYDGSIDVGPFDEIQRIEIVLYDAVTLDLGTRVVLAVFSPLIDISNEGKDYQFSIDLPSDMSEGRFIPRLLFFFKDAYPNSGSSLESYRFKVELAEIQIDKTPPEVTFEYGDGGADPAASFWHHDETDEGMPFTVMCSDAGAGCFADEASPPFPAHYPLKGNFCESSDRAQESDDDFCNTTGARSFEVCDRVGNCTTVDPTLEFYANERPSGIRQIKIDTDNDGERDAWVNWEGAIVAGIPTRVPLSYGVNGDLPLDDHACGPITSPFEEVVVDSVCREKRRACVDDDGWRGEWDAINSVCDTDLIDANACAPGVEGSHTNFPLCFEWWLTPTPESFSWDIGTWNDDCSNLDCGGIETRSVVCLGNEGTVGTATDCSGEGAAPENERACGGSCQWGGIPFENTAECSGAPEVGDACSALGDKCAVCNDPFFEGAVDETCDIFECEPAVTYSWVGVADATCTENTCGELLESITTYECQEDGSGTPSEGSCTGDQPDATSVSCGFDACAETYSWHEVVGDWGECSASCGGGIQFQTTECHDSEGTSVDVILCDLATRPATEQACNEQSCQTTQEKTCTVGSRSVYPWKCTLACGAGETLLSGECHKVGRGSSLQVKKTLTSNKLTCEPKGNPQQKMTIDLRLEAECLLGE